MMDYFEQTDKVSDLIKASEDCIQYLQEDSVGYHYMWMLWALKQLNSSGNLVVPPLNRFRK